MKPIPLRWVDINKGSETAKEYRSRLVVMETKRGSTIAPEDKGAVFSATPPLEAVRMLASLAMSFKGPIAQHDPDNDIVIGFLDISRAHSHVEMKRELHTELPPETQNIPRGKSGVSADISMGYEMLARILNSRCRRSVRELVQNVECTTLACSQWLYVDCTTCTMVMTLPLWVPVPR